MNEYVAPTYTAPKGAAWYHFLHGYVPNHEIDFIYHPDIPQGPLVQQHFSHLARLVKYIEPRRGASYAFAIGNLSRDDTQYEAGRGGIAIMFGLRVHGVKDHAGRQDPPFCHAVGAIARHLDQDALLQAASAFHEKIVAGSDGHALARGFYREYAGDAQSAAGRAKLINTYIRSFDDVPGPGLSKLSLRWVPGTAAPPKRVIVVHPDDAPFDVIAAAIARIAAVLVESSIRWTVISTGREGDMPGGVTVRFVPANEATTEGADGLVLNLADVPVEPHEIAEKLFAARQVEVLAPDVQVGWRERFDKPSDNVPSKIDDGSDAVDKPENSVEEPSSTASVPRRRSHLMLLIAVGVFLAVGGAIVAVWALTRDRARALRRMDSSASASTVASQLATASDTSTASTVPTGSVEVLPETTPPTAVSAADSSAPSIVESATTSASASTSEPSIASSNARRKSAPTTSSSTSKSPRTPLFEVKP